MRNVGSPKKWLPVLRALASVGMLAVLIPRLHVRSLFPRWDPSSVEFLLGAVAVSASGVVLSAVRWQRVLAALDVRARIRSLLSYSFAGLFVGNFLPSTIGGDVLRVTRLSSTTGDAPASFASVVIERLTGWVALPVLSLVALTVNRGLLRLGLASQVALAIAVCALVLLVAILAVASSERLAGRFASHENWLRFLHAVHEGVVHFRRHPAIALEVLLAAFVYQLAVVFAAYLASVALDIGVSWSAVMAFMPIVAMVQVLPVTIGGLGVREGALVLFLSRSGLGATTQEAIAFGLLLYFINLLVSLAGAPAFAVGARPVRASG